MQVIQVNNCNKNWHKRNGVASTSVSRVSIHFKLLQTYNTEYVRVVMHSGESFANLVKIPGPVTKVVFRVR